VGGCFFHYGLICGPKTRHSKAAAGTIISLTALDLFVATILSANFDVKYTLIEALYRNVNGEA